MHKNRLCTRLSLSAGRVANGGALPCCKGTLCCYLELQRPVATRACALGPTVTVAMRGGVYLIALRSAVVYSRAARSALRASIFFSALASHGTAADSAQNQKDDTWAGALMGATGACQVGQVGFRGRSLYVAHHPGRRERFGLTRRAQGMVAAHRHYLSLRVAKSLSKQIAWRTSILDASVFGLPTSKATSEGRWLRSRRPEPATSSAIRSGRALSGEAAIAVVCDPSPLGCLS